LTTVFKEAFEKEEVRVIAGDSSSQPSVAPKTLIDMLEHNNKSLAPGRAAKVDIPPDVDTSLL
jgi:hypothetical protein